MDKKRKIGRNDPCPCGSGKKYKHCCGANLQTYIRRDKEIDYFKLNREIAYRGKVGRMRQDFCIRCIRWKQLIFKEIEKVQIEQTAARGETITCYKGCSFCCMQHVSASLHECEAIVYYLYQNERVLTAFLEAYPRWRAEVKKNGDIFRTMEQRLTTAHTRGYTDETRQAVMQEAARYFRQNIHCPFLSDGDCLIYDVRPFACAGHFSTSPAEWCNPLSAEEPKIYEAVPEGMGDFPFYYGSTMNAVRVTMPIVVYQILQGGFVYLSTFPTLEALQYEAINDPEIKAIRQKYL